MVTSWIDSLTNYVEAKPCVLLRFNEDEWEQLHGSRRGVNEFTLARSHGLLSEIKVPTICLIFGHLTEWHSPGLGEHHAYIGIISSRSAVTTLDTRIKVKRAVRISPNTESDLLGLVVDQPHAHNLQRKLKSESPVLLLSPKLSGALIAALAGIPSNHGPMRAVVESLTVPRRYSNFSAVQEDAVQTALKAFGLAADDRASGLELIEGQETALARVAIMEDSVIEHDARSVPGYTLVGSDVTGRAIFRKNNEQLEVFTANRRTLEQVFGVDLIYLNLTKRNIVMVQYKMLEPDHRDGAPTDWLYRPEQNMIDEIRRMELFAATHAPGPLEYRLNPQVFYLKFVKRDGAISNGGIITPIDHYKCLLRDPACKGPRGALRISYSGLGGRYLRQGAFLDLIQSGYIGAFADTTQHLSTLVQAVLDSNKAVVAAVQTANNTGVRPQLGSDPQFL